MLNATALWQINGQREHNGKLHQLLNLEGMQQ